MTTFALTLTSLLCCQQGDDLQSMLRRYRSTPSVHDKNVLMLEILERHWAGIRQDDAFARASEVHAYFLNRSDNVRLERILKVFAAATELLRPENDGDRYSGAHLMHLQALADCQLRLRRYDGYEKTIQRLFAAHDEELIRSAETVDRYLRYAYAAGRRDEGDARLKRLIAAESARSASSDPAKRLDFVPSYNWKYRLTKAAIDVGRGDVAGAKAVMEAYRTYEANARARHAEAVRQMPKEERAQAGMLGALAGWNRDAGREEKLLAQLLDVADGKFDGAIARAESEFKAAWRVPTSLRGMPVPVDAIAVLDRNRVYEQIIEVMLARADRMDSGSSNRLAALLLSKKGVLSTIFGESQKVAHPADPRDGAVDWASFPEDKLEGLSGAARSGLLYAARRQLSSELICGDDNLDRLERLIEIENRIERSAIDKQKHGGTTALDFLSAPTLAKVYTVSELQSKLGPKTVFVDFQKRTAAESAATPGVGDRYIATVLRREGPARVVDLGPAARIESDVAFVRKLLHEAPELIRDSGERGAEAQYRRPARQLAGRLFGPLVASLEKDAELVVSPDGPLWGVPWAALVKESGAYLIEEHSIVTVSGPQGLLATPLEQPVRKAVVVANPDYGKAERPDTSGGMIIARGSRSHVRLGQIPQLTFAEAEGQDVQARLKGRCQVEYVAGADATAERALKVTDANILHYVTHGFALAAPADKTSAAGKLYARHPSLAFAGTGILLANCNRPRAANGLQEGLLTGLQIVNMNLKGTHLVVLSACETGLGQPTEGEGVLGLGKAFHLAGARQVISTLWLVPDRPSAVLVSEFYKQLDLDRIDHSLRLAQCRQIQQRRERSQAAHPYYWAAYTLTR